MACVDVRVLKTEDHFITLPTESVELTGHDLAIQPPDYSCQLFFVILLDELMDLLEFPVCNVELHLVVDV